MKLTRNKTLLIVLLCAVAGAGLYLWQGTQDQTSGPVVLVPDNSTVIARGKTVYAEQCAACHGSNLEGQPGWKKRRPDGTLLAPPHNETGHTWHHRDQLLFDLTKLGLKALAGSDYKTDMPVYKDILSDADIIATLSWIKSTWPADISQRHDQMNQTPTGN